MSLTHTVRGEILLPAAGVPEKPATIVVQVEDVSRADAPSVVVGELRLRDVKLSPSTAIPFQVEVPAERIDQYSSYSIRVHIDTSGSGEVEVGDLVSTRSYPVLTRGNPDRASVRVQRV